MIFNPRTHNRNNSNQEMTSNAAMPFLNIPYHLPYSENQSNCGLEEWQNNLTQEDNTRSTLNSLNMSNVSVSYDIYGNELLTEEDEFPRMVHSQRDLGLESIEEEETISPDPMVINQENKDPILHMITPVKRRDQRYQDQMSERRSLVLDRSPLLDITPSTTKKRGSHVTDGSRHDRSFLNNMTPTSERNNSIGEIMFTRKFR